MVNNLNNIKMEKEMLLLYEAPVVEIIEVEVEKGFAQSNSPSWGEETD